MKKDNLNEANNPQLSIADVSGSLSLTKTDITHGISFTANCFFWETKYEKIYLTDYNLDWSVENLEEPNLLKDKGDVTLFYKNKGVFIYDKISACVLGETDIMLRIIDNFYLRVKDYP